MATITGFMGINYSTDEIKNGKFVDVMLESDFLQARFDLLRTTQDRGSFNESVWKNNGVQARKEFLKILEDIEKRNRIRENIVKESDDDKEDENQPVVYTYDGGQDISDIDDKSKIETVIVKADEIEDGAFENFKNLKSVVFNDNVKKIGDRAFQNCQNITNIRLNSGVNYIGDNAFKNCSNLISIEIGSDVQHIGMGAFQNCMSLTNITIPPNVTFMGDYVLSNCPSLKTITILDGVVEIPSYFAINDISLEEVTIPSSVEKVGESLFLNCPNLILRIPTTDKDEAEEFLGVKMIARAEDDSNLFKCNKGFMVKLYKDLY